MFKDMLGNILVETPSGGYVVVNDDGQYLIKSVDPWGYEKPVFDHKDFAMRFTKEQAHMMANNCWWSGNKVKTTVKKVNDK